MGRPKSTIFSPNSTTSNSSFFYFTRKVNSKFTTWFTSDYYSSHWLVSPAPFLPKKVDGESLGCYSSRWGADGNVEVRRRHKFLINMCLKFQKDTQAIVHVLKRFLISKEPRLYQLMDKVDLHAMNQGSSIFHSQEKTKWLIRKAYRSCHSTNHGKIY